MIRSNAFGSRLHRKNTRFVWMTFVLLSIFAACKKEDLIEETPQLSPEEIEKANKIKDTTLEYARDIYLWYKQIPSSFDARAYADPDEIMTAIRQYSVQPGFGRAVDRWSFAVKKDEWDEISSGILGDMGLQVFFPEEDDLRVRSVEAASPAGKAGVRRGWRILSINSNANIKVSNADFILNSVYGSRSSSFTFQKPDGSVVKLSLTSETYTEQPVYLDTVYTAGSREVGYLVFNSFMGDTTKTYSRFQQVFDRFARANVKDVVVDLRYNGGGYVTVQQKLANYLAPLSANGGLMMKQEFNDRYTDFNSTDYFHKLGTLNPSRIFFIVSHNTASASELLINNLKPYVEVKLVGSGATYGKPVGYFPIDVADWYIFPISFRSTNKNGEGDYYDGIPVDSQTPDGLDKDWGDLSEASLNRVIKYITSGSFGAGVAPRTGQTQAAQSRAVLQANDRLSQPFFKGMIDTRGLK